MGPKDAADLFRGFRLGEPVPGIRNDSSVDRCVGQWKAADPCLVGSHLRVALVDESKHPSVRFHDVEVNASFNETLRQFPGARTNLDDLRSLRRDEPVDGGIGV